MSSAAAIRIHSEQKKEQTSHFACRFVANSYSSALLIGHSVRTIPPENKTTCSHIFIWFRSLSLLCTAEDVAVCFYEERGGDEQLRRHLKLGENWESNKKRLI